jgi:hypothetical protein
MTAAFCMDWDTGSGQGFNVAQDRPGRHLKAVSELLGGHPSVHLEQQDDRQQTRSLHVLILAKI